MFSLIIARRRRLAPAPSAPVPNHGTERSGEQDGRPGDQLSSGFCLGLATPRLVRAGGPQFVVALAGYDAVAYQTQGEAI